MWKTTEMTLTQLKRWKPYSIARPVVASPSQTTNSASSGSSVISSRRPECPREPRREGQHHEARHHAQRQLEEQRQALRPPQRAQPPVRLGLGGEALEVDLEVAGDTVAGRRPRMPRES